MGPLNFQGEVGDRWVKSSKNRLLLLCWLSSAAPGPQKHLEGVLGEVQEFLFFFIIEKFYEDIAAVCMKAWAFRRAGGILL